MLGLTGLAVLGLVWAAVYVGTRWLGVRGKWRRPVHHDVAAVGVLIAAILGFYWPLFFTESWIPKGGGDLSSFIYPTYAFGARWLRRGVIPLWNPHLYMGMPFAADNQSGLFYPVNLFFFLAFPDLTYPVVELMAVSHVFLAGLFAYILLRDLPSLPGSSRWNESGCPTARKRVSRVAALAGAIAYMFSDLFVVHPGNLNIVATAAWLPLALFCFRRALSARRGWRWTAWSGIVLGIAALAGHAQLFLYVGMTLGLYALFEVFRGWKEGVRADVLRVVKLALVGATAFGLAALALIPAYDLTRYTVRAEMDYARASDFAILPAGLVSIVVPGFFGRGTGPFWGPWTGTEMGYVGIMPLVLAAIAVALNWRRPLTRFWLLLAGLGLLVALGGHTVLHGWTYALIPFFRQLRVPARAIVLFDFGVAMLAAQGLDRVLRPLSRYARAQLSKLLKGLVWICGTLALVGVPIMGHAVLVSRQQPREILLQIVSSMGSVVLAVLLMGVSIGWLVMRQRRLASRAALAVMAVAAIAFDLISLGAYVEVEPNDPLTGYRNEKALEFLRADPEIFRVETPAEVQGGWAPDWALIHEMDDLSGIWNPLRLGAYDVLTWVGIGRESRFYDLYNVKYLIAGENTTVPAHFEPVLQDGKRMLYRNPRALPRAFMVYRAEVVDGDIRALNIAKGEGFDPAAQVVLKAGGLAQPLDVDAGPEGGRVEIVDRGPNHLDFEVDTPVEGYLVVSEMWMPGWVAEVSGERQDVLQANYTFRAVYVPPGSHSIHMTYRPQTWAIGVGVTLSTCALLIAWAAVARLRRKRRGS